MVTLLIRLWLDVNLLVFWTPSLITSSNRRITLNQRRQYLWTRMNLQPTTNSNDDGSSLMTSTCSVCGSKINRPPSSILQQKVLIEIVEKIGLLSSSSPESNDDGASVYSNVNKVYHRLISTYNNSSSNNKSDHSTTLPSSSASSALLSNKSKAVIVDLACSVSTIFQTIALQATIGGKKKQLEIRQQLQKASRDLLLTKSNTTTTAATVLTGCIPLSSLLVRSSGCRQPPVEPVDGQTHCLRHHSLQWGMDQSAKPLDP